MQQFRVVYLHMRYIHCQHTYGILIGFVTSVGTENIREHVHGFISSESGCTVWQKQTVMFIQS